MRAHTHPAAHAPPAWDPFLPIGTGTLPKIVLYYYTTILLYYYTTILLYYYTTILLYYYVAILRYYDSTILLYLIRYYDTAILRYYYTTTLRYYRYPPMTMAGAGYLLSRGLATRVVRTAALLRPPPSAEDVTVSRPLSWSCALPPTRLKRHVA